MELQYVYLIQEREFIQLQKPIYKVGKTKQPNFTRFTQYPKDSALIFQSACNDCDLCEKEIIQLFKKKYQQKKNIGTEYFEGNFTFMLSDICDITSQLWKKQKKIDQERKAIEEEIKRHLEAQIREEIEIKIECEGRRHIEDEFRQKSESDTNFQVEKVENKNEWTAEFLFSCSTCRYSTKRDFCLQVHLKSRKHLEQPNRHSTHTFHCNICDTQYRKSKGLWAHNKKNHE
jgi:hypothetical protein